MRTLLTILTIHLFFLSGTAGQLHSGNSTLHHHNAITACLNDTHSFSSNTTPNKKGRLLTVITGTSVIYTGYMSYLQYVWYKDHERVPFHFYHDLKGYNQIDKLGHIYGSYMLSYMGFHSLRWAGVSEKKAAWYGGGIGFLMQLPIEIWDGMYEGWGFSWSDMIANGLGSALLVTQQLKFQEQIVNLKFSFSPSPYARQANGYLGTGFNQILYDYNGHTYWLSSGLNRVIRSHHIPRWINLAVGYSAGGMFGEFENKTSHNGVLIPEMKRYRQFLFSLDVDFSKISTKRKMLQSLLNSMVVVKIPFPTIELNTKGELKVHPLYF